MVERRLKSGQTYFSEITEMLSDRPFRIAVSDLGSFEPVLE
jgi:hypothetical protein